MSFRVTLWNNEEIVDDCKERLSDRAFVACDDHVCLLEGGRNFNREHELQVEALHDQVMATQENIGFQIWQLVRVTRDWIQGDIKLVILESKRMWAIEDELDRRVKDWLREERTRKEYGQEQQGAFPYFVMSRRSFNGSAD